MLEPNASLAEIFSKFDRKRVEASGPQGLLCQGGFATKLSREQEAGIGGESSCGTQHKFTSGYRNVTILRVENVGPIDSLFR